MAHATHRTSNELCQGCSGVTHDEGEHTVLSPAAPQANFAWAPSAALPMDPARRYTVMDIDSEHVIFRLDLAAAFTDLGNHSRTIGSKGDLSGREGMGGGAEGERKEGLRRSVEERK
ncbi:hypothetical protein GGR56DRAFT_660595 [Xylariaceae sp. FL0804]|nr:hypothetical protein GGR56DRAFT_660595 [Xylariaceae sp. FL0804]